MNRLVAAGSMVICALGLASCADENPGGSLVGQSAPDQWRPAGEVAESSNVALFLTANTEGSLSFATVDSEGVVMGAASIGAEQQLVEAVENPAGDWLAVVSDCVSDSGNPCGSAELYRIDSKLEKLDKIDAGEAVEVASIRPLAGLRSGDFMLQTKTDSQIRVGNVGSDASAISWIWDSPEYDLEAIREVANRTQDFEGNSGPSIDFCDAGSRFIWRFSVSTAAPVGMEVEVGKTTPREVSVPSVSEAPSFECAVDKIVAYWNTNGGTSLERISWRLEEGRFNNPEPVRTPLALEPDTIATVSPRPGGGAVVTPLLSLAAATFGDDSSPSTPATSTYVDADASELTVLANSASIGRPVVTDAGELVAWNLGNVLEPAK